MIKNFEHAKTVQERRTGFGKQGIAKAVKRWLRKQGAMREVYARELPR